MVVAADAAVAEVMAVVAAAVMVVAEVVDHCTLEPVLQDRGRSQKICFPRWLPNSRKQLSEHMSICLDQYWHLKILNTP